MMCDCIFAAPSSAAAVAIDAPIYACRFYLPNFAARVCLPNNITILPPATYMHRFIYLGTYADTTLFYLSPADPPTDTHIRQLAEYYADTPNINLVLIGKKDQYRFVQHGMYLPDRVPPDMVPPMLSALLIMSDYDTSNGIMCSAEGALPYRLHDSRITKETLHAIIGNLAPE